MHTLLLTNKTKRIAISLSPYCPTLDPADQPLLQQRDRASALHQPLNLQSSALPTRPSELLLPHCKNSFLNHMLVMPALIRCFRDWKRATNRGKHCLFFILVMFIPHLPEFSGSATAQEPKVVLNFVLKRWTNNSHFWFENNCAYEKVIEKSKMWQSLKWKGVRFRPWLICHGITHLTNF